MNTTHTELKRAAADHRQAQAAAVAAARVVKDHWAGRDMPASAVKQMRDHLREAEHHGQEAEVKAQEAYLREPQYRHDMVGGGSSDADRDERIASHILAMDDTLPDELFKAVRSGDGYHWSQGAPEAKAMLGTSDVGTSTTWNGTRPPAGLLLASAAGVSRVGTDGISATFPRWGIPDAAAGVAEGANVSEYADVSPGLLTQARYGRWSELSLEAGLSGTVDLLQLHRLGVARDLNKALIDALTTAHGPATGFVGDREGMLRLAIATVSSNLGVEPGTVTVALSAGDFSALGFQPTSGGDVGSVVTTFAGAQLFVTPAVTAGTAVVFHGMAVRYYEAHALEVIATRDPKSGKHTVGTHTVGGYGVGLVDGISVVELVAVP